MVFGGHDDPVENVMVAASLDVPKFGPPLPTVLYNAIRKAILEGVYRPGESVRQEALARVFSVSRVPVREALSRLEAEGLLVLRPRRGYIVKELDTQEIVEIFEMRAAMEEHAAYVATKARKPSDVQQVKSLLESLGKISSGSLADAPEWVKINRRFHNRIFASSRRTHLCQAIRNYRDWVDGYIRLEIAMTGRLADAHREHCEIVKAFADGDADLAAHLSRAHCTHTLEQLLEAVKHRRTASTTGSAKTLSSRSA